MDQNICHISSLLCSITLNMSNKKEPKMEKAKKSEKPSIDSHREFLDMDTDEEDFSQQGFHFFQV